MCMGPECVQMDNTQGLGSPHQAGTRVDATPQRIFRPGDIQAQKHNERLCAKKGHVVKSHSISKSQTRSVSQSLSTTSRACDPVPRDKRVKESCIIGVWGTKHTHWDENSTMRDCLRGTRNSSRRHRRQIEPVLRQVEPV